MRSAFSREFWKYYLGGLYNRIHEHHSFVYAGGMSFSILLSLIPFALVAFSILGHIVDSSAVQEQINNYINLAIPYPDVASAVTGYVQRSIEQFIALKGIAGILGIAGLLFIASGLFSSMKTALNRIYHVSDEEHPLISILRDMGKVVVVLVFLLLLALIFPAVEAAQSVTARAGTPDWPALELLKGGLFYALSLALALGVFYLLYRFVPSRMIDHRRSLSSAVIATILWEIAKQGFGFYFTHFATVKRIYGAYALIVIAALWLYYTSLVFILSAEIAQLSAERGTSRWAKLRAYFAKRKFGIHH